MKITLKDWWKFTSPFSEWQRVINWIFIGYYLSIGSVDFYAAWVLKDTYAFDAGMGFFLVAIIFYFWQESTTMSRRVLNSATDLIEWQEKLINLLKGERPKQTGIVSPYPHL